MVPFIDGRRRTALALALLPLTGWLAACDKASPPAAAPASAAPPTSPSPSPAPSLPAASSEASTPSAATPPSATSKDPVELLKTAVGFTVGDMVVRQETYVFFDPQCPHCAELWQAAASVRRSRFHWAPVDILSPLSGPQGATIIGSANPSQTMAENEALIAQGKKGVPADEKAVAAHLKDVKANTELMDKLGGSAVPFIVTMGNDGKLATAAGAMAADELAKWLAKPVTIQ